MNTRTKEALAEALLVKHGLGWTDDSIPDEVWTVGIKDLFKLAGVWTNKAHYRIADLRKQPALPEGRYHAAAGICVFKHRVIFIDRRVRAKDFEQVMLHEIAHALVGKPGHGNEWRKVARRIGYKFAPLSSLL